MQQDVHRQQLRYESGVDRVDWVMIDEMYMRGYANTDTTHIVDSLGSQTSGVWKWINISRMLYGPTVYTVPSGALTQTFQIGAAEPGGWYNSFVFAPSYSGFTANDLNLGNSGTVPPASTTVQPNWLDLHQQIDGFGASSYTLRTECRQHNQDLWHHRH